MIVCLKNCCMREKGRDLTQSYDNSPYTSRNVQKWKFVRYMSKTKYYQILLISMHLFLRINVNIDFISVGSVKPWGTQSKEANEKTKEKKSCPNTNRTHVLDINKSNKLPTTLALICWNIFCESSVNLLTTNVEHLRLLAIWSMFLQWRLEVIRTYDIKQSDNIVFIWCIPNDWIDSCLSLIPAR